MHDDEYCCFEDDLIFIDESLKNFLLLLSPRTTSVRIHEDFSFFISLSNDESCWKNYLMNINNIIRPILTLNCCARNEMKKSIFTLQLSVCVWCVYVFIHSSRSCIIFFFFAFPKRKNSVSEDEKKME